MPRYCSKLRPPPIQSLLGSFHTHQYQFVTSSGPHSSTAFHTTSPHCVANQRMARGSSKGRRNLAHVTIGTAPTLSTACTYSRKMGHCFTGSGPPLSKRKTRINRVSISRNRSQISSRRSPSEKGY